MQSSLFKNLRLQTYLQVVNAIIPIITTPYIARVLGASTIGIFSSTHAFASFFTLFAVLGTNNYGTRCLSAENDKEKRKKLFLEIYILQLVTCFGATVCYLLYCIFLADNKMMAYLQLITLVGCFLEISWYYFGIEEFKITVVCNLSFRLASLVLLLTLVKKPDDLWVYTVITLGSALMSQLLLWLLMLKNGLFIPRAVRVEDVTKHFIPNIRLFIPLLAMTVCTSTDKAMLGKLSTYEQAGYYSNIDRVINVPFSIFSGISTVFLPRMTAIFSASEKKAKDFFFVTLTGIIMLGVAISCGIIAVADTFIPFFLGTGYDSCVMLIKVFSPVIIVKCISNAVRLHYLVPFKREDIFIGATCIGAVLNVIVNYILIPRYGALGAIVATIVSEIIVLFFQTARTYKIEELIPVLKDSFAYLCIGVVMIVALHFFGFRSSRVILKLFIEIVFGALFYCLVTLVYWKISKNEFYELYIKNRILRFFNKIQLR